MKRYILLLFATWALGSVLAQPVTITPPVAYINEGESVQLTASGATFYQWSPSAGLSNTEGQTVVASPYVTTTYMVNGYNPSNTELVVNGDFEQGNYGFTSSYQYAIDLIPEGTYCVGENANNYHPGFIGMGYGGVGNFMIVNGATNPGTNVWTEQIAVIPNTNYAFSTWICNVSVGDPDVVALLQFSINGVQLGEFFSGINQLNVWEQFYVVWNSGNSTTATITILNQNTEGMGNDFGLDDISFRQLNTVDNAQCTVHVQTPDTPLPDNIDSANCVFFPSGTEWSIGQPTISNVGNAIIVSTPMIGDVDNDGQQEIVIPSSTYSVASQLNIYNANGTLKSQFNIAGTYIWGSVGLARVKWQNDSFKTIIVVFGTNKYLYAYDANGTQLWQSNQPFSSHNGESCMMPAISFADFNHDGWTEVFIGSEIFDAATGVLLCKATGNKGCADRTWSWSNTPYQTMAADLCGNSRLELAIGNTVYDVDIQSRTDFSANHITTASQLPTSAMFMEDGSPIPFTDGNTFLADINLDGSLDVIVMNVDGNNRIVYLYVWDVATNTIICSKKITNARKFGTPQIGDLDNNSYPEICFITGTYSDHGTGDNDKIYALKYNPSNSNGAMDVFWSIPHEDNSGSTGLTMFDFNQDGYVELVYRDCNNLRIINGSLYNHQTGQSVSQPYDLAYISCCSATGVEYPVIADVDLDGEVEIIVGGETYSTDYGHLYIFKSAGIPWAPARKVWNQFMYNVTNVNMDLTIPEYLFNNATPFTDPQGVVRRPFNNFLQQATTIDQYGRPFYAVPDVATISANITTGGSDATLNVSYTNLGDNTLNAPYYITVFANQVDGTVLQTITVNTPLPVGGTEQQSITIPMSALCQLEDVTTLVVAINCNGGGIAQNGNLQPECDITNNTTQITINLQSEPTNITETACNQFVWYGQTYTQSGQYETTIPNSYGCDSILVLNLTINHSDTTYLDIETCEDYLWYGTTYSQTGVYQHLQQTAAGCDSLLILSLNIGEAYHVEESVEDCDSYFWPANQQWYYQSALDSVVVQGQQSGCDSTFVLSLTLHYSDTLNLDPTTVCEDYEWHGVTYTESGTYTFDTLNQYGCSRWEILDLTVSGNEIFELDSITACDEYVWHGQPYAESGTYTFDTLNQYGCTLQYILPLTINHSDTVNYNITACESYEWNGQTYSQSGDYIYSTTNEYGCSRLENLHLTLSTSYRQEDEISDCDSYFWPKSQQWYYQSALDSIIVQGALGECDSTFVMNLTLHYSDTLDLEPVTACDAYEWHGMTYTESGTLTYQTTNEYGCPRLERLDLTISDSETIEFPPVTNCDEYTWYGVTYTESGTYTYDTLNQYGCLLQYVLPLTINHSDTLDWDPVTSCDSYLWYGLTITETGDYSCNTINSEGCTRLERIHITINYSSSDTLAPVTACDNYVWHDATYTQSGVYSYETEDQWGCLHTEVLFLTINRSSEYEFNVTSCEPYLWYGTVYDVPGTYYHNLTNAQGCDSLLIMHLDIGETFIMEENAIGCESYDWHGMTYSQGGDYQYEATNPDGCDSIFILHLAIAPTYEEEMEVEACYSYTWITEVFTESGDYERHFSTVMGCDSLVTLHLTINDAIHYEFEQQTCLPYTWNGITYYVDGDYEQTFVANNGCDSIVTMHLKINEHFNTDITVSTCDDVYTWNGIDYYVSGVYQQSFLSSAGCDSIVNLHLSFVDSYVMNIDTASCEPIQWGDDVLTVSGQYHYQYVASSGCDSIVNLSFSLMDKYEIDDEKTSCIPIPWGSEWLTESGYYQQQFMASTGCDSIVHLHFHLVDSYEVEIDTTACESYLFGNEFLTETGLYQYQFMATTGCDSIVKLQLTVKPAMVNSIYGLSLIYPSTDMVLGVYPYYLDSTGINPANVRWSINRDDWQLVPHGASCDLICTSEGLAELHAWTEGEICEIDTTLTLNAMFFDIEDGETQVLSVYPNPTRGIVTITWQDIVSVRVINMYGQKIAEIKCNEQNKYVLDISPYQEAVYLLEIVSRNGTTYKPIILTK